MTAGSTPKRRAAAWFSGSVNRRILAAILTVAGFSLVVKATATLKELAVAYRFGTGDAVDAFFIAFLVPSLVVNVVAGSLTPAFTPVYIDTRERQGAEAARQLLASSAAASLVLALAISLCLAFVMPLVLPRLAPGFSAEKLVLTRTLFIVL